MSLSISDKRGYSDCYLDAREKIDDLCRRIMTSGMTAERALRSYEQVEAEFADEEPENADLFKLIYKSRVVRLADQFSPGDQDES